jgi:hypothetical protein
MTNQQNSTFRQHPATKLGWWALYLAVAFWVMSIINNVVFMRLPEQVSWRQTLLPFYGILMLLCGLVAGVVGLIALLKKQERSWMVWLAILSGAYVLFLLVGEFLVPH